MDSTCQLVVSNSSTHIFFGFFEFWIGPGSILDRNFRSRQQSWHALEKFLDRSWIGDLLLQTTRIRNLALHHLELGVYSRYRIESTRFLIALLARVDGHCTRPESTTRIGSRNFGSFLDRFRDRNSRSRHRYASLRLACPRKATGYWRLQFHFTRSLDREPTHNQNRELY